MNARITFNFFLLTTTFGFVGLSSSFGQNLDKNRNAQIDSIVLKAMDENKIVGISLGIVKDGKILYTRGYGTKEIGKSSTIDSTTNFLTCSISKLFTATAIMQLVEQGKIDIRKKLIYYIPDFTMKDDRYKDITIEQMLTHTSGIPNKNNPHYIHSKNDSLALSTFANKLKKEVLSYPPGVQLSAKTYSNAAYDILGLVIERITNQTFSQYVTNHILKVVGMDSSSFFIQQINNDRRSIPHKKNWLSGRVKSSKYYPDIPQDKPCGNLNSCSYDLSKWMIHNLDIYNAANKGEAVLETKTLTDMWTTKKEIPPYSTSIGLGWWIVQSKKYGKYVFHDGNDPGYSAALIISPKNNFGIVILCNGEYPRNIIWNKLPFDIINLFEKDWLK